MSDNKVELVSPDTEEVDPVSEVPPHPVDLDTTEVDPISEVPSQPVEGTPEGAPLNGSVVTEDEDKKTEPSSDIGTIPPPYAVADRRQSNLTVENLKLHEEREEKSRHGSTGSIVKTTSQHSVQRTSSPLAPLKGSQRTGSGGKTRPESGQRTGREGIVSPVPSGESLRTGSSKPLPPIGVDKTGLEEGERKDSFIAEDGPKTSKNWEIFCFTMYVCHAICKMCFTEELYQAY